MLTSTDAHYTTDEVPEITVNHLSDSHFYISLQGGNYNRLTIHATNDQQAELGKQLIQAGIAVLKLEVPDFDWPLTMAELQATTATDCPERRWKSVDKARNFLAAIGLINA